MDANDTMGASETLVVDVAVVGGGPTGALAALVAAEAGWRVALVAPAPARDPRTTALLMPSVALLDRLGVWEGVAPHAAALTSMRIIDDTGRLPRAPEIAFDAHEISLDQFGFNVENDHLNAALADRLASAGVRHVDELAERVHNGEIASVEAGETRVEAELIVGADGIDSVVRAASGLAVKRWRYNQSAFVTVLSHARPHGNASIEFHTPGGPFTLVPLPGERSSLVFVERPEVIDEWASADPGPLARELERRAHAVLGRMQIDGPRAVIPLEGMVAHHFGVRRAVLVGEAGHRLPPIGAQGLNLGIRDVAILSNLLERARPGRSLAGLADRYDSHRRLEVGVRSTGVDLLNRSLLTSALPLTLLRTAGLTAAREIGPVRRAMMRAGLAEPLF
ncbi:FAD-dependent monooxygenase [Acuticoccus mangrovi]|uniref:FAD-dependent monooxygenase n=1 Tax=Acuticoccus mangrovi TaxID=2796142 RepID=A0A934ILV1_9HYPH|nr:FAD-dependent monooxygenase [Acuticoccus mangrovi]MBJ3774728.1 FAD-dependent monooxygenase [Acuticoccus mangrovi]